MIRVNLVPSKRRKVKGGATIVTPGTPVVGGKVGAQVWLLGMLVGWAALGALGWWLNELELEESAALRKEAAAKNKEADAIKKEIDETGLSARENLVNQTQVAIKKVKEKRRTPAFVLYEIAMILTDSKDGGGPDVDQEKYRQNLKSDPQSAINDRWDPAGLWIDKIVEKGGVLEMAGSTRDASDLTEFTRRLRASARFGSLSNAEFIRDNNASKDEQSRYLTWTLNVGVRRWD
jgi:Tfp pilus assembly protein PilN